jgi:hypothetical protein
MSSSTPSFIVSFVIMTTVITAAIVFTAQNLSNAYNYSIDQTLTRKAKDTLLNLVENPGVPANWASEGTTPTIFGLKSLEAPGSNPSPFGLMRLMTPNSVYNYDDKDYYDLSTNGGSLFLQKDIVLDYEHLIGLVDPNGRYGFQLVVTPLLNITTSFDEGTKTLSVNVTSASSDIGDAQVSATLYRLDPNTLPDTMTIVSETLNPISSEETKYDLSAYDETYFVYLRAIYNDLASASCFIKPGVSPTALLPIVTNYATGEVSVTPSGSYSGNRFEYAASFQFIVPNNQFRFKLFENDLVNPGEEEPKISLSDYKSIPGYLLIFYRIDSTPDYGLSVMPWGLNSLGYKLTLGSGPTRLDSVVTQSRVVNVGNESYDVEILMWRVNPSIETISSPTSVTVTSNPPAATIMVDGISYTALDDPPLVFTWTLGSHHSVEEVSPPPPTSDTRYNFLGWSDGGAKAHDYLVLSPTPLTANYKAQYLVNFEVATDPDVPERGGTINPNAAGWYDSGSKITVEATPDPGFAFKAWSSEGSITFDASVSPTKATIKGPGKIIAKFAPPVAVTINANIPGAIVNVDEVDYTTPHTFTWGIGSSHNINAVSTFPGGVGIRYYFTDWSDGGAQPHQYIVNGPGTVTANYKLQYLVTFAQTGSGMEPTVSYYIDSGSVQTGTTNFFVWVDAGHDISYTYPSTVDGAAGVQYVLTDTSPASPRTSLVAPVTVTGTYKTRYQVTFIVEPPGGGTITQTDGWYDAGDLGIEATPNLTYLFLTWSASNPSIIFLSSIEPSTTATIGGSGTIQANFAESKEITITSSPVGATITIDGVDYTTPHIFTWGLGSGHNINAYSTFLGGGGIQYYFTDWSDGGAQSHQYIVTGPDTVTATYNTQCKIRFEVFGSGKLKVNGAEVASGVEKWYDAGVVISLEGSPAGKFIEWGGTLTVVPNPAKPYEATHTVSMSGTIYLFTR